MRTINDSFVTVSSGFLAIQNILQNLGIFNRSRGILLFMPSGEQNVKQFPCCSLTQVSDLKSGFHGPSRDHGIMRPKGVIANCTKVS